MAATQSPHSASEPSTFSPSYSTGIPRKRKRGLSVAQSQGSTIREYGFMRDNGEHDTARFVGSSSGIHFIRNVHARLARQSASRTQPGSAAESTVVSELVPGEDDQLRRRAAQTNGDGSYLWQDHEVTLSDEPVPSFDQFVEWSKSYFEAWHPILPFLNGPDVLRIFEDASQNGISSLGHLDHSIMRSVLSISLADSRQGPGLSKPIPSSLIFRTVEEAMSCSQFALGQPASIRATQAALAIQLFLISMLCLNAASRLGGLIVRMAFHLGLHRCPMRYPFFTTDEAATRRRVFWCLYCSERFICQSLGIPLDIRDDDVDVCYPGEELHGTTPSDDDNDQRLQLLTYTAKHAKIRGLILELRNKSIGSRQDTTDREIFVQTELAKWSNEIQDTIEEAGFPGEDQDGQPTIAWVHRLILLLSKYESTISLNRPMMASDPSTPAWAAAMQACISAAKSICITLRRHVGQKKIAEDQSGRRLTDPMLWPSFTWAAWISAFILAYAAFEQQMPLESAMRHIESSKDALRHIAARDTSWPEYCLSAIDELTSAVKEWSDTQDARLATNHPARQEANPQQGRMTRSRAQGHTTSPSALSNPTQAMTNDTHHGFSPVVASSAGLSEDVANQNEQYRRPPPAWQRNGSTFLPFAARNQAYPLAPTASTHDVGSAMPPNGQFGSTDPEAVADAETNAMPGEGQESMMWYDQLFASSFSAIDNPFLAAAQFDSSIDPTWSYLR